MATAALPGILSCVFVDDRIWFPLNEFRTSWEHIGSVVECLTRDRKASGLSLAGLTLSRA